MNTKIFSATTIGIDANLVKVEIDIRPDKTNFYIVGLGDTAIQESKKRVQTALHNMDVNLKDLKITINLSPASLKKEGTLFDLPIAMGILQACNKIDMTQKFINETVFIGELSLDGTINAIHGALPISSILSKHKKKRIIVPLENAQEASIIDKVEVIGVNHLNELISYINKDITIEPTTTSFNTTYEDIDIDFSDVKGQGHAKRVMQIAAAGKHNVLFQGPPGTGKTMLAKRLITIMPPMQFKEACETSKIYSVGGVLKNNIINQRPFRNPHHTISSSGLLGGGASPKPGEVSLAHNGILFLDEFIEFKRSTIEGLRQSLESGISEITRAQITLTYPADFILIAAYNPCPCGYLGDIKRSCTCSNIDILKYKNKLSGPILDRIDIKITINSISYDEAQESHIKDPLSSLVLKEAVLKAVETQYKRFGKHMFNSQMSSNQVKEYCILTPEAEALLKIAFDKLNMSMRTYHKVLKVARTVADLDRSDLIDVKHIQEAIVYKS